MRPDQDEPSRHDREAEETTDSFEAELRESLVPPQPQLRLAHSATGSNAGPSHTGAPSPEDNDVFTGTSSGSSLRGKPHKGSREDIGM